MAIYYIALSNFPIQLLAVFWQLIFTFDRIFTDFKKTLGRHSADIQHNFGRLSEDFWKTLGRLSDHKYIPYFLI